MRARRYGAARAGQTDYLWRRFCDGLWGMPLAVCRHHCDHDRQRQITRFLAEEQRVAPPDGRVSLGEDYLPVS